MACAKRLSSRLVAVCLAAVLVLTLPSAVRAYSVLTHETIVDAVWDTDLKPLLRARFPQSSEDDLHEAHAYAYGGCLIQDLGYYPFGSKLFTDLAHYVRSGDFVEALLKDATTLDEYAFALGALAHYASDNVGHPAATNRAVPILYPKLQQKYGAHVTFAENPAAHLKTEFGFDVAQVAQAHFAPNAYRDFIGFKVAKPLLERAFEDTYDFPMKSLFASEDLAIGTYRRAVSTVIPKMTKVAWETKHDEIVAATPGITRERFVQVMSRASYEHEWGTQYERPGKVDRILAFLFRLIPKIGPFRALAFKAPTPEVERLYLASFNRTVSVYRELLGHVRSGTLHLEDLDLDTGTPTEFGGYPLADRAFAQLLDRLADRQFEGVSPALRDRILAFYRHLDWRAAVNEKNCSKRTAAEILALERLAPSSAR